MMLKTLYFDSLIFFFFVLIMKITLDNLLTRFNINKKVHFSSRHHKDPITYLLGTGRLYRQIFRDYIIEKPNILQMIYN